VIDGKVLVEPQILDEKRERWPRNSEAIDHCGVSLTRSIWPEQAGCAAASASFVLHSALKHRNREMSWLPHSIGASVVCLGVPSL